MYEEHRVAGLSAVTWRVTDDRLTSVLPDGCMDLVLLDEQIVVAGPDLRTHHVSLTPADDVIGLRFDPGVLPALLGVPAHELRDLRVPLTEVIDRGRLRGCRPGGTGSAAMLALARHLTTGQRPEFSVHPAVVRGLAEGLPVTTVARTADMSERTLRRLSHRAFGYGPVTLHRILRLQRAVRALDQGVPASQVAVDAGYADQAHLSREVRALTGMTVSALRRSRGQLPATASRPPTA